MFHEIPSSVTDRMRDLEARDELDRSDGTPRMQRLRQIPPVTGRFLALWAASAPPGTVLEVGTSAGYSTLWLALACRATGRTIQTFEILPEKARLAQETFEVADVLDVVRLVHDDFLVHRDEFDQVGFCFLDAEKEVYEACFDVVVPKLVPGGILIADNAISHREELDSFIARALDDDRVDAMIVPIGTGELVCRKR